MKELQPGIIRSCCRGDRHPNNQINIKSLYTTRLRVEDGSVRATLPPSMLFADCAEPYRNTLSIPNAKGSLLYLLSSWAYTRIGL